MDISRQNLDTIKTIIKNNSKTVVKNLWKECKRYGYQVKLLYYNKKYKRVLIILIIYLIDTRYNFFYLFKLLNQTKLVPFLKK
jgi:hypothetical protein